MNTMRGSIQPRKKLDMFNQDFKEFIASLNANKEGNFLVPDQVIQIACPPNRIDILISATGVEFGDCCGRRVEIMLGGEKLNFIDLESF